MDRQDIISRVRKFAAMTTANGASESEAAMAAKFLAKLIAEHNIQETELTLKADAKGCLKDSFTALHGLDHWTEACWAIGRLFHCEVYRSKTGIALADDFSVPTVEMNFYGYPQDVAACIALCRIIYLAVGQETNRYGKPMRKSREKTLKLNSFSLGMAKRLNERVNELIPPPQESTGRGLMVLKDQLVTSEFADYCTANKLRIRPAVNVTVADYTSFHAGRAAAANVNLTQSPQIVRGHYHIGSK